MSELDIALAVIGAAVLSFGAFARLLDRWGLPEPLLFLALGVLLGPRVADFLRPSTWGDERTILEQATRLTLAVALMGVALRIPPGFLRRQWRSIALVLVLAMPFMALSSGLLVHLIAGLPLLTALLIGAVISPTDPVVASTIVTGDLAKKKLPDDLKHLLSSESGLNDGLAYLFVFLPILLATRSPSGALSHWLGQVLFREVLFAVALGLLFGLAAGHLLRWAEERELISDPSIHAYTTALALFSLAAAQLLGTDGILAVFLAGIGFDSVVSAGERLKEERVVEGIDRFFTLPSFLLLGLLLPWGDWVAFGWRGPALVVGVLLLRRLPLLLLLTGRVRTLPRLRDTLFLGWFGPLGIAALFYAGLALRQGGPPEVWTVTSGLVCASVVIHGLTAMPLTRLYGRARAERAPSG